MLTERSAVRHTPVGLPVVQFKITHQSDQTEAEHLRKITCQLACVAIGKMAHLIAGAKIGEELEMAGFVANKSLKSAQIVFHAQHIVLKEDTQHGI